MDGDDAYLAKLGKIKKRNQDHDSPPPSYVGGKQQIASILKNPKKLDSPRLRLNEKLRVRQFIVSDPSTI